MQELFFLEQATPVENAPECLEMAFFKKSSMTIKATKNRV